LIDIGAVPKCRVRSDAQDFIQLVVKHHLAEGNINGIIEQGEIDCRVTVKMQSNIAPKYSSYLVPIWLHVVLTSL
jgi:hypothetical protein